MQFYHASWYSATFQCVINSAVGHFEQNLFNWLFVIFWVNILGYSENFPWNRKNLKICLIELAIMLFYPIPL